MKAQSNLVTVIIPNWNGKHLLQICLQALERQVFQNFDVIVVDNGSEDDSVSYLEKMHPLVNIVKLNENTGFAKACNIGIRKSRAKYVALLNNDTEPSESWLEALIETIESAPDDVGCLASKMLQYHHPTLIDDAGDILTWRGGAFKQGHGKAAVHFNQKMEVLFPCAGAALYRRHILVKLGGFDETFVMYLEDIDLGLRIRLLGFKCFFVPQAEVLHVGHGSDISRERYIFFTARNRLLVFLKNIPLSLLIQKSPSLFYGWLFFWLVHRGHFLHLKGSLSVLKQIPHIVKERRKLGNLSKLSVIKTRQLISNEWPEISIFRLLRNTLFG